MNKKARDNKIMRNKRKNKTKMKKTFSSKIKKEKQSET